MFLQQLLRRLQLRLLRLQAMVQTDDTALVLSTLKQKTVTGRINHDGVCSCAAASLITHLHIGLTAAGGEARTRRQLLDAISRDLQMDLRLRHPYRALTSYGLGDHAVRYLAGLVLLRHRLTLLVAAASA